MTITKLGELTLCNYENCPNKLIPQKAIVVYTIINTDGTVENHCFCSEDCYRKFTKF